MESWLSEFMQNINVKTQEYWNRSQKYSCLVCFPMGHPGRICTTWTNGESCPDSGPATAEGSPWRGISNICFVCVGIIHHSLSILTARAKKKLSIKIPCFPSEIEDDFNQGDGLNSLNRLWKRLCLLLTRTKCDQWLVDVNLKTAL